MEVLNFLFRVGLSLGLFLGCLFLMWLITWFLILRHIKFFKEIIGNVDTSPDVKPMGMPRPYISPLLKPTSDPFSSKLMPPPILLSPVDTAVIHQRHSSILVRQPSRAKHKHTLFDIEKTSPQLGPENSNHNLILTPAFTPAPTPIPTPTPTQKVKNGTSKLNSIRYSPQLPVKSSRYNTLSLPSSSPHNPPRSAASYSLPLPPPLTLPPPMLRPEGLYPHSKLRSSFQPNPCHIAHFDDHWF